MRIHEMRQKVKESKFLQLVIAIMVIGISFFYLKTFFTSGIYFDSTFLKKHEESSETHYIGKRSSEDMQISVITKTEKTTEVIYELPHNFSRKYTVTLENSSEYWPDDIKIEDEQGDLLFHGTYSEDQYHLTQKNGEPLIEDFINFHVQGHPSYTAEYNVHLKHVADMAFFTQETIRGDFMFLFLALLIFSYTAIDYKFPLFFFHLQNSINVRNPEPSDFYLEMQELSWIVLPIIGLILAIIAIL